MGEATTTILGPAWTEITTGVTQLMGNDYTKLMIILPVAALVIGIAKGVFSRRRRG